MVEAGNVDGLRESDEVANDAIQLLTIANFNGLCRIIAALSASGHLTPGQLDNIHDAVTTPLDDPDWRDYGFIAETRDTFESVLARAMVESWAMWSLKIDPD